jgi:hypothetical protein
LIQNLNHVNQEADITHHHRKWNIQQKCQYIALSLQLAKEHMNIWTREHCCTVAVKRLTNQGLTLATHAHHRLQVVPQIPAESKLHGSATLTAYQPRHLHEHSTIWQRKLGCPFHRNAFGIYT